MNKGHQFWRSLWDEGRLPFHNEAVNQDLVEFLQYLKLPNASRILVPLCGKTKDMIWLAQQGYQVIGIELVDKAVRDFAVENHIPFVQERRGDFTRYSANNIEVWVADIFAMDKSLIEPVDAIYDRSALVALPSKLRPDYAQVCLNWLKPGGAILLKTLVYDQSLMEGPPYSVTGEEIHRIYKGFAQVKPLKNLERKEPNLAPIGEKNALHVEDFVWLLGQFSIAL